MRYDFDRIIDRRSTNSMKWNVAEGELPMWVADMDFATVPEVTEMLQRGRPTGSSDTPGDGSVAAGLRPLVAGAPSL